MVGRVVLMAGMAGVVSEELGGGEGSGMGVRKMVERRVE